MRSWWGKSSSKEGKRKANKESFIDAIQRKLKIACEEKTNNRSEGFQRGRSDTVLERVSKSRVPSRSPSPSTKVLRCQSFVERPRSQPLPLPGVCHTGISCSNSGIIALPKPGSDGVSKPLHCLPHPRDGRVSNRVDHADTEGDLATASVSSGSSSDSDDPPDSFVLSPLTSDYENGNKTGLSSPSSVKHKDVLSSDKPKHSRETLKPANHSNNNLILATSPKEAPLRTHVQNLHIPHQGPFCTAPDSSLSSPSRSPMRAFGPEQFINSVVWAGKACSDVSLLGSGHCSSPGSGHSGQNSIGGDISGQLFWPNSRCSPECSPIPSPRMSSPPGPSSRIHSGSVSPLHSWAGGITSETSMGRPDGFKQQSHRLPLPPITISRTCPFSPGCSTTTSPSLPRSPNRAENPTSPGSCWKKGRLLGKGVFGDVYLGFNSESGEMCAMKEVILFSDDAKSKESAQQLRQEIALLSRLRHPNIVQYYGSKVEDDKLYIYLEYVSGGSIYKLLQEYGQFGEVAIRNYTQQILSGLSYLHGKNTVHRDIKGANILVDPSGRIVKLADFGMAKHINGQSCPLSFKGSPYWMAPEVIMNSNGCNPAVDIWSLGCTVLEMATTKPPWSQYEAVPAMFKIGKSKELPTIPDHLSNDGKDFVRQCLQRDPSLRPSAVKLLAHPFVSNVAPLEKPISSSGPSEATPADSNGERSMAVVHARKGSGFDSERVAPHQHRGLNSDVHSPKNISCSVSPIGSPLLRSRSPQHGSGILSPSPISSSRNASGSSTPLTGDSGVIPIHHSKQPISLESIGMNPRSQNRFYTSSPYWEPDNGLFRGVSLPSHLFQERTLSNNGALVSQLEQYGHGCLNEHYEYRGQPMLSDRVSQQLLGDHVKLKSFMGLNASSSARGHTNRT